MKITFNGKEYDKQKIIKKVNESHTEIVPVEATHCLSTESDSKDPVIGITFDGTCYILTGVPEVDDEEYVRIQVITKHVLKTCLVVKDSGKTYRTNVKVHKSNREAKHGRL